jgi:hypothetical protein
MKQPQDNAPTSIPSKSHDDKNTVYLYEAAGLRERHGYIPLWLWGVALALSIWGIYYLITYWQEPSVPVISRPIK